MKSKGEILSHIMSKISKSSEDIRLHEGLCRKFLIDPTADRAYTALVAYRSALTDLLDEIKGNKNEQLFGENKSFSTKRRS